MTVNEAYTILGVNESTDKAAVKKRYRELMHMVHPDSDAYLRSGRICKYSAYEINEAYSVISAIEDFSKSDSYPDSYTHNDYGWDALQNEKAYTERNIYHNAEDYEGKIIGRFVIARGKYIWTIEEDFKLFIKSIFDCSEEILKKAEEESGVKCDSEKRIIFQAELSYLLAQQFISSTETLDEILTSLENDNSQVFYVASMLEVADDAPFIRAGMKLYPSGIKRHRLYLVTKEGRDAGYVSLRDDRLYYILIPILEQRRALVKIEVSHKQDRKNMSQAKKYKNLDLWVKLKYDTQNAFPENINIKIENLMKNFKEALM